MSEEYPEDAWVPSTPIVLTTAELDPEMSDEERNARIATLREDMTELNALKAQLPDEAKAEIARVNEEIWAAWEADPPPPPTPPQRR